MYIKAFGYMRFANLKLRNNQTSSFRLVRTSSDRNCSTCPCSGLCLISADGNRSETAVDSDNLVATRAIIDKGFVLHQQGDIFRHIYSIRMGSLKSSLSLSDGRMRVIQFHSAGDVVGLDGVATGAHHLNAVALSLCEICIIPFEGLMKQCAANPESYRRLLVRFSAELVEGRKSLFALGNFSAEERLALFLVNESRKSLAHGGADQFKLRMSRADVANYISVSTATLSRLLGLFRQRYLIHVNQRNIKLLNLPALYAIAGVEVTDNAPFK